MTAHTLRLDLILRRYPLGDPWPEGAYGDLWTWRLWSGSRIVSSSGSQRYSRRIDCARGAEVGAGIFDLANALSVMRRGNDETEAWRYSAALDVEVIAVRIRDERT